ncbi:MAG: glycosyltransferase [Candidatus Devosia phytovorans]|uniref:Glycosyltransferase n=1 Tax=Candidatus Devosia phytovorans TaxID=3121372 RepID=A0AAJ5VVR0_9HYPH|nr:glycosyltransferase [Devosia sp.]WEK05684.1 MAG: glycosyltransferase [Devosia sp.]
MSAPRLDLVTGSLSRQGGGVAEVARQTGLGLVGEGTFDVRLVATRDGDLDRDLHNLGTLAVRAYRFFGPSTFRISPGLFWRVLTSDADVMAVHGLWAFHGFAVLAWHLRTGRPYVLVPHGMLEPWILRRSRGLKRLVSLLYQDLLLHCAAGFQVLTEAESRDVRALLPAAHCVAIANAVGQNQPEDALPQWHGEAMRSRRVYLFFGRIHDKKGWLELCLAWQVLCRRDCGFAARSQLVFCGWLDQVADFDLAVAALNAEFGNVSHVGPQYGQEKARSLQAAHVLVLPSKSEGLPVVVLEAWSHGIPVLMTEACNLPQGFASGAALRIGEDAPSVIEGLAQADRWDKFEIVSMSKAARALVAQAFSPAVIAGEISSLLQSVLVRSGRAT